MKKSLKTQIVEFVAAQNRPVSRTEILKFIFNLRGLTYTHANRGSYSDDFVTSEYYDNRMYYMGPKHKGYFMKPGHEPRYLERTDKGYIAII